MDHLIARTRGKLGTYYKLISGREVFQVPVDLKENGIAYGPGYKLEDEEWFCIPGASKKDYFLDFLGTDFVSAEYDPLPSSEDKNIEFLCSCQGDFYCFQRIVQSQLIRRKWVVLGSSPQLLEDQSAIVINDRPDAIYIKSEDMLFFRKLTAIANIFKGIDSLYREATQSETENFLRSPFISLEDGYSAEFVKKANRNRIAMAIDTLANFGEAEKASIFEYIRGYCSGLIFDDTHRRFSIKSEHDLKLLLYGIEQRYYTTLLGNEKRLANSVTQIS